ncbi:hypothetical protein MMC20_002366 [Loxospora ochrophaea]|nr:hypothetical protein [Loxospora ochrophaea]
MHQFLLSLRQQLLESQLRVIEIFPPLVQTELHDKKHQPDIEDGANMGMPLNEFVDETWDGLAKGKDEIPVQMGKEWYEAFEPARQAVFKKVYC